MIDKTITSTITKPPLLPTARAASIKIRDRPADPANTERATATTDRKADARLLVLHDRRAKRRAYPDDDDLERRRGDDTATVRHLPSEFCYRGEGAAEQSPRGARGDERARGLGCRSWQWRRDDDGRRGERVPSSAEKPGAASPAAAAAGWEEAAGSGDEGD